jgi:hypothetical protein
MSVAPLKRKPNPDVAEVPDQAELVQEVVRRILTPDAEDVAAYHEWLKDEQGVSAPEVSKQHVKLKGVGAAAKVAQSIMSPDNDAAHSYFAFVLEEAFGRIEQVVKGQSAVLDRLSKQLIVAPQTPITMPAPVVHIENTPSQPVGFRVTVTRDAKGMISELDVKPVTPTRVMN